MRKPISRCQSSIRSSKQEHYLIDSLIKPTENQASRDPVCVFWLVYNYVITYSRRSYSVLGLPISNTLTLAHYSPAPNIYRAWVQYWLRYYYFRKWQHLLTNKFFIYIYIYIYVILVLAQTKPNENASEWRACTGCNALPIVLFWKNISPYTLNQRTTPNAN